MPFDDEEFDEIHAYEVLEHIGRQGDWRGFFDEWNEYYRILKPGGKFYATVPGMLSPWVWGDPSHVRCFPPQYLTFLEQKSYEQVGKTAMSDFRHVYHGDFRPITMGHQGSTFYFVLERL